MNWLDQLLIYKDYIRPALDILILSFLIYQGYKILVQTRAIQLIKGAFFVAVLYAVAFFFKLNTLLWIMNSLATVFVLILAIVFQPELRNIFTRLGRGDWFKMGKTAKPEQLDSILNAVDILSNSRRGALLVFPRRGGIKNIIEAGTKLNADLSSSLILTIFGHDTPLHDGAVVIQGGKIMAASCFLPLSEQADIRRSFGTRHRAALGLAEETDAVVLVVSEETGALSLAYDANLYYDLTLTDLKRNLKRILELPEGQEEETVEGLYDE